MLLPGCCAECCAGKGQEYKNGWEVLWLHKYVHTQGIEQIVLEEAVL